MCGFYWAALSMVADAGMDNPKTECLRYRANGGGDIKGNEHKAVLENNALKAPPIPASRTNGHAHSIHFVTGLLLSIATN